MSNICLRQDGLSFFCCFVSAWVFPIGASRAEPENPVVLFESGRFDEARTVFAQRLEAQAGDPPVRDRSEETGSLLEGLVSEARDLLLAQLGGRPGKSG